MSERQYAAVEVIGRAGGMNQQGWEGAIPDSDATYLYNMSTTTDGEWTKRKGYEKIDSVVLATTDPPTLKLHWHTDTITDQTTGAGWVESGDESSSSDSGALDVGGTLTLPSSPVTLGGESTYHITPGSKTAYIGIKSSFNLDFQAGRIAFYIYVDPKSSAYAPGTLWRSTVYTSGPGYDSVWQSDTVFFFDDNWYLKFTSSGLRWKYGSGATEYIDLGFITGSTWHHIDLRWDNVDAGTIYPYRYQAFVDGTSVGYADPSGHVSAPTAFDTDVFFLNTGSSGDAAPYVTTTVSGRTTVNRTVSIALISTWSSSSASPINSAITGIHNNSSQQRAVVSAGAGVLAYSPSYATAAATSTAYTMAGVRTSGTECQGNIYIVDGTDVMKYMVGSATTVSVYTLPEDAKWIEEFHGHLWIAGLNTADSTHSGPYSVRCSNIDDFVTASPTSWPSTNQVFKCRDTVRGIKAYGGMLIVGTRTTIEGISGYQPHDFAKTIISNGANCASHWSMKEVPLMDGTTSALIWAGYDGIYRLMGNQVTKISWPIEDFFKTLSKTEIEEAHAVDCRENGEYMLAVSDGSVTENNYLIVYNYRRNTWSIWKYSNRIDVLGKYYKSGIETILGGDSQGNIYELNRSDSDNGSAINGYVLTKWFDGGVPDQEKDFRKIYVWASPIANYDVEVGWSTDYKEGMVDADIVVGTDGNDYKCIVKHEPSVVVGDDGNDYYCVDAHNSTYLTKPGPKAWSAFTNYSANDIILESSHIYRVTTDNGASGENPPSWDDTHGNTTVDGDLVWTCDGASASTSYWTATGTVGRGETWAISTDYVSNDDKKPITGGQYAQYFVPNNTIGVGETWSASTGYSAEVVQMESSSLVSLGDGEDLFGTAIFGTDVFGSGATTKVYPVDLYNARGRSIRFLFRNQNSNEPFSIRGFKAWFTYVPEFPA